MSQPEVRTIDGRRSFPCFPAAIVVFVIDEQERFLLLAKPGPKQLWEVVNGGLDAGETLLDGCLRETREEAGPKVAVRPLGVFHASSFHYDCNVKHMISVAWLVEYLGGPIEPGDDMQGSAVRWASLDELAGDDIELLVPVDGDWLFRRAVDVYRLWRGQDECPLQRDLSGPIVNKYQKRRK